VKCSALSSKFVTHYARFSNKYRNYTLVVGYEDKKKQQFLSEKTSCDKEKKSSFPLAQLRRGVAG
jgi:hypothetical protein